MAADSKGVISHFPQLLFDFRFNNNLRMTACMVFLVVICTDGFLRCRSKQDLGDLKEVHKSITGSTWEKDKEVTSCTLCEKQFSIARRKVGGSILNSVSLLW